MTIQDKDTLKTIFQRGKILSQDNLHDFIESSADTPGDSRIDFNTRNLTIAGDLSVQNQVLFAPQFADEYLTVNKDGNGAGGTTLEAGILIERGTATDFKIGFRESDRSFIIGMVGDEHIVATLETAYDGGLARWDDSVKGFQTSAKLTYTSATNTLNLAASLQLSGDLEVLGDSVILDVQTLEVADTTLQLNSGQAGAGVTDDTSGLEIERGSANNYFLLYRNSDKSFVIGENTNLQALINRQDSPEDTALLAWNDSAKCFDTSSALNFSGTTLYVGGDISVSGLVAGRDINSDGSQLDALYTTLNFNFSALDAGEVTQLGNIGDDVTLSAAQWGYLSALDQSVVNGADVSFAGIGIAAGGTITEDGRDLLADVPLLSELINAGWANLTPLVVNQLKNIAGNTIDNGQWAYVAAFDQNLSSNGAVNFVDVRPSGLVDGRDISGDGEKLDELYNIDQLGLSELSASIVSQVANIGSHTISLENWTALSQLDQDLASSSTVSFGNITVTGSVDGEDIAANWASLDNLNTTIGLQDLTLDEVSQLGNIGTTSISAGAWQVLGSMDQSLVSRDNVAFTDITITVNGQVDGRSLAADALALFKLRDTVGLASLIQGQVTQLADIDGQIIESTQWTYLAALDQSLSFADNVAFKTLTVEGQLTATLPDDIVDLAALDTGISPSSIVVAAGTVLSGTDSSQSFTVADDLENGDMAVAQCGEVNDNKVHVQSCYVYINSDSGIDSVDLMVVLSAAPAAGTDIHYTVYRSAS